MFCGMENPLPRIGRRSFKNGAENDFCQWARSRGHEVTKRGWPDFFVMRMDGDIALVEVKARRGRSLKSAQMMVMRALASYGVPCYRWDPENGFERILPSSDDLP